MAISVDTLERCCRLCAEEQEVTIMIFSEEAEAMLLQNKLNNYLLIEVDEDDRLPKNICIKCCSKLQTVCEFIDTARKAQDILQSRSHILEQNVAEIKPEIKVEIDTDNMKYISMEVSVDPMMVLQNSDDTSMPDNDDTMSAECIEQDVTYLHGVDGEDVTIKLIKKGDKTCDQSDDKKDILKPFQCKACDRGFNTELALKNHSWIHFNEDKSVSPYNCSMCEDQFDYKSELISHLKKHRMAGMCKICGRIFRTERNLAAHLAAHTSSTSKSYTCKVCGRSYNTNSNLKSHSITHNTERPYKCQYCKKCFKRNQDLKFHINQHTGAKPYKCPFCDKCFASSGNCYSHKSRMHPGGRVEGKKKRPTISRENKPLQPCPIAPKPTAPLFKPCLKYQCTLCEHSFFKRDNYMYHMYQHTGEKPFQCSLCSEKFVTRRGLLLHYDKTHPGKDRPLALISRNALLK